MNNQAKAYLNTLKKLEKKYVNSSSDVENVLPQPLEDAVKVGEKRKSEEKETEDNRGENTTDDQVNDSKRLKPDIAVDHEKGVKKVILDLFHVPEQEQDSYEDKNTNQVFVEILMKQVTQPNFKDYLKLIMNSTPDLYRNHQSQLLYLINTAVESHRRASDKGELSDLFNKSYVPCYIDMALSQSLSEHASTNINRQIDAFLEKL